MITKPKSVLFEIALALGLALTAGAQAKDARGNFVVHGVGAQTCSAYLAKVRSGKPGAAEAYASWLLGYLSASNAATASTFDLLPVPAGQQVVDVATQVCAAKPDLTFGSAVDGVVKALAPLGVAADGGWVTVAADGRQLAVRRDALIILQRKLIAKRLLGGQADGASSPQLVAAIKAFQTQQKLTPTGLPDVVTLLRAAAS